MFKKNQKNVKKFQNNTSKKFQNNISKKRR